ncbi:MAG: hypothetical protein Alis3KO_25510 [Aliiglaciecola sp.]
MKKFLPTLIIGAAIFAAGAPQLHAKSLDQKIETAKQQQAAAAQKINVNTASAGELQQLPGIGAKKASDIVAYRKANGKFSSLQDLTNVRGVGDKMVEKLKEKIVVK